MPVYMWRRSSLADRTSGHFHCARVWHYGKKTVSKPNVFCDVSQMERTKPHHHVSRTQRNHHKCLTWFSASTSQIQLSLLCEQDVQREREGSTSPLWGGSCAYVLQECKYMDKLRRSKQWQNPTVTHASSVPLCGVLHFLLHHNQDVQITIKLWWPSCCRTPGLWSRNFLWLELMGTWR